MKVVYWKGNGALIFRTYIYETFSPNYVILHPFLVTKMLLRGSRDFFIVHVPEIVVTKLEILCVKRIRGALGWWRYAWQTTAKNTSRYRGTSSVTARWRGAGEIGKKLSQERARIRGAREKKRGSLNNGLQIINSQRGDVTSSQVRWTCPLVACWYPEGGKSAEWREGEDAKEREIDGERCSLFIQNSIYLFRKLLSATNHLRERQLLKNTSFITYKM